MKQAFIYTDDKSQKFWIIDSDGSNIMVNFGKLGATGRYQITEYDDEVECQKAADKLITQKTKKATNLLPILISSTAFILTMKISVRIAKPRIHTSSDT